MSRKKVREPECGHRPTMLRVSSHKGTPDFNEAHASIWVCARAECVYDAQRWVAAITDMTPLVFDRECEQVKP